MNIRSHQGVSPKLGVDVYIDQAAVVIGDVEIGDHSSVWPMTVIRGDIHRIRIGARTSVQDGSVLHVTHAGDYNPDGFPLLIGDEVTIGHQAMLHGCRIGRHSLIGIGSTILNRAVIGANCIVGAQALVTEDKTFPDGVLIIGAPARVARELNAEEIAALPGSAQRYIDRAAKYRKELSAV